MTQDESFSEHLGFGAGCGRPASLHNMSVPSTSRITVARAALPGLRFRVRLHEQVHKPSLLASKRLASGGWRAAWELLEHAGDAPTRPAGAKRRREPLEQYLEAACKDAGIPDRLGVFVPAPDAGEGKLLSPAAAFAVLARRSGPLYVPTRRLEPSLAVPLAFVLFFPEETR
jgi:hypothetical protein